MTAARIVILTGHHLCHNPRVLKEASTLADAGFDVEVLGGELAAHLTARDRELARRVNFRFTPVLRLEGPRGLALRAQRRIGTRLRAVGIEHPSALGYGHRALLRAALARTADLYIAHSEPALWSVVRLARAGHRIGVDMEDWFSRDLLPEARRHRPLRLLEALEREALERAAHRTCPSHAMSSALADAYGVAAPAVVYNAFPWSDRLRIDGARRDRAAAGRVSLHWFSQTIGPGRGLDQLLAALPLMRTVADIHLRGALPGEYAPWLWSQVPEPWRARLAVHPLVPNGELLSRVSEHDIGLALEPREPENKDLTVSNKLLQYLQAGLAVVATATTGQSEVAAAAAGAIRLCAPGDARGLAAALDALVGNPAELAAARAASLAAASRCFSWEHAAPVLLGSIHSALGALAPA